MNVGHVLIVEDEFLIAMDLQTQLESVGARLVKIAGSVQSALRFIAENTPDCAIIDFRLSGAETTASVARALAGKGVPFIVATGNVADAEREFGDAAHAYIGKPFDPDRLTSVIAAACECASQASPAQ